MISFETANVSSDSTLAIVSHQGNHDGAIINNREDSSNISLKTELRHIPPYVKDKLGQLIEDRDKHWQIIMAAIPQSPPWYPGMNLPSVSLQYPKKYSVQDCRLLETTVSSGHLYSTVGNGINVLLEEWGCSGVMRPTLGDLINLLERNKLYAVISYLRRDVLNESTTEDTTNEFSMLDALMNESKDNHTLCHNEIYSTDDSILNDLLEEQTNNSVKDSSHVVNAKIPPVFDQTVVPHVPYELLASATANFSDRPYNEGGYKLGEGAFGVVFKADIPSSALNINTSSKEIKKLAIKKLSFNDDKTEKQFKVEVEVLSQCKHRNILELDGYSCDGPEWCLMYEFMSNGNLQDKLASTCEVPLKYKQRLTIIKGMADGIAYLHAFMEPSMVHRDIKSANILLDSSLIPKIGDFGLVRIGGKGMHTKTMENTTAVYGTSAYMAPEAFRGDVSIKLDTFSYGVVLLEILTGLPVYDEDRDGRDLLSHIEGTEVKAEDLRDVRAEPWPVGLPKVLSELSKKCVEDKRARPSMEKVVTLCEAILNKW